jgi:hypothetical protein
MRHPFSGPPPPQKSGPNGLYITTSAIINKWQPQNKTNTFILKGSLSSFRKYVRNQSSIKLIMDKVVT